MECSGRERKPEVYILHAADRFIKNNRREARKFDRPTGWTFNQLSVKIINGKLPTAETFRARQKQTVFFLGSGGFSKE